MQITIVVPDDIGDLIKLIAGETGRSQSGLCADWVKDGCYKEIEQLNKAEVYKAMLRKKKAQENQSD